MFLLLCLLLWHLVGVFCDETAEVSVKKGDSVTLHSDFTGTQTYNRMEWRFGDERIARIKISIGNKPEYEDERFRDRLKMDNQTGSLTISNMTISDSGCYQLIIQNKETFKKKFNVTVNEASIPSVHTVLISAAAAGSLLIVVAGVIFCICRKHRKTDHEGNTSVMSRPESVQTHDEEITYANPAFHKRNGHKVVRYYTVQPEHIFNN
ncbi:uncharacterized protein LOC125273077 [Megalobrama amblycephala]|uniref:uncharacterized protein LOC125273077 n=1 Tax=Megalobrama amblycephala TaxID=75352 RepID=UPI00201421C1|nr:uncharacterized protein LOC125273077 [Megalobrama amblycephala]